MYNLVNKCLILFNTYMQANFYYTKTTNIYHLQKSPLLGRLEPLVLYRRDLLVVGYK